MATVTLGSQGLLNADLVLVQNVSFSAVIVHETEDGEPIDHAGWTLYCQAQQGTKRKIDLNACVYFGDEGQIIMLIPDEVTRDMPLGTYNWDLIGEDETGYATRIVYGRATVYDSYARDE